MATNNDLSNLYLKDNPVATVYLGDALVWPKSPILEFTTSQISGEIKFNTVSTKPYIGVVVNEGVDANIYVNTRAISAIKASQGVSSPFSEYYTTSGALYKNYKMPLHKLTSDTKYYTEINLPLYARRSVNIRGRHSRSDRYLGDVKKGQITVTIINSNGGDGNFRVKITPGENNSSSTTKTQQVNAGRSSNIIFNKLKKANYTVRIDDLTENSNSSTNVSIDHSNKGIGSQSLILSQGGIDITLAGPDDTPTKLQIYSLNEEEAFQSLYGSKASIEIATISIPQLSETISTYGGQVHLDGVMVISNIRTRGSGLPANKRIPFHLGYNKSDPNGTLIRNSFNALVPLFDIITNSGGSIEKLEYPNLRYNDTNVNNAGITNRTRNDTVDTPISQTYTQGALGPERTRGSWNFQHTGAGERYGSDREITVSTYVTYADEPKFNNFRGVDLNSLINSSDFQNEYFIAKGYDIAMFADSLWGGNQNQQADKLDFLLDGTSGGQPFLSASADYDPGSEEDSQINVVRSDASILWGGLAPAWASNLLTDTNVAEGGLVAAELGDTPLIDVKIKSSRDMALIQSNNFPVSWPYILDNAGSFQNNTSISSGVEGAQTIQVNQNLKTPIPGIVKQLGSSNVFRHHSENDVYTYFPGENRDSNFSPSTYLIIELLNEVPAGNGNEYPYYAVPDPAYLKIPITQVQVFGYQGFTGTPLYEYHNDPAIFQTGGYYQRVNEYSSIIAIPISQPGTYGAESQLSRTDLTNDQKRTFHVRLTSKDHSKGSQVPIGSSNPAYNYSGARPSAYGVERMKGYPNVAVAGRGPGLIPSRNRIDANASQILGVTSKIISEFVREPTQLIDGSYVAKFPETRKNSSSTRGLSRQIAAPDSPNRVATSYWYIPYSVNHIMFGGRQGARYSITDLGLLVNNYREYTWGPVGISIENNTIQRKGINYTGGSHNQYWEGNHTDPVLDLKLDRVEPGYGAHIRIAQASTDRTPPNLAKYGDANSWRYGEVL